MQLQHFDVVQELPNMESIAYMFYIQVTTITIVQVKYYYCYQSS